MELFLSTFVSKLDDKNRISIPAPFRAIIEKQGQSIIYATPSLHSNALEMRTISQMQRLQQYIDQFELFTEERQLLETALLTSSEAMNIDSKGRIYLTENALKFTQIGKEAAVVGKGATFEIWSDTLFKADYQQARTTLMQKGLHLLRQGGKHESS